MTASRWDKTGPGKLKVIIDEPSFVMPFSVFSLQPGWAFGEVGFESIEFDIPLEEIFAPDSSANVEAVLVAFDPGCRLWSPSVPMNAGEALPLGNPFFDYHPIWQIETGPSVARRSPLPSFSAISPGSTNRANRSPSRSKPPTARPTSTATVS